MVNPYSLRLARLRESIEDRRISGFLVTSISNVRYLSGFMGSSGLILITRDKNIFVTDFRYREEAEKALNNGGAVGGTESPPRIEWDIFIEKGTKMRTVKKLVRKLGIRWLGFESSVSYDTFKSLSGCGIRLKPLTEFIESLRAVKDNEEIWFIREAVRRAEAAFLDVKPYLRQGRSERQIAMRLEERLKKRGCYRIPFDIIVASGVNSALPHARATDKKISSGDLVVIDWGGEAGGYYSDITRTFLAGGRDISEKIKMYRAVMKANRKTVSSVKPDIRCRDIDKAARDVIKNAGYGDFFGHGTGHGVGLEIHEKPHISWTKKDKIHQNMVFTIEPGVYIPGLGGVRIEDMVLVKSDGAELLTKMPRDLEVI